MPGVLVGILLAWTAVPAWLIVDHRGLWLAIPTVLLRRGISVRLATYSEPPPADPVAELPALQARMGDLIERVRASEPRRAEELARPLDAYTAAHGVDTVATSRRPTAVRNAARLLAGDLQGALNRLPITSPAFSPRLRLVECARRMVTLVEG